MRLLTMLCVANAAIFTLTSCGSGARGAETRPEPKPSEVHVKAMSFDPRTLQIRVGDAVVWINDAHATHTAASDDEGRFDTGEIAPAQSSKPIQFPAAGEFKYHCKVHGKAMSGTVVVQGDRKG